MPRLSADRDAFVRRIGYRRQAARWIANARLRVGLTRKSHQAEIYDGTFKSDDVAVTYFYALRNDHLPDFENPTWVNEKVRWQFLNHPNPLMSLAADKIAVRDYLRFKQSVIQAPEIIATGSTVVELSKARLPERFAFKSASSSGHNHIEDGTRPIERRDLVAKLEHWNAYEYWRHAAELHYRGLEKRWIVEELIEPTDSIIEYKLYCIHGEPVFILVIRGRVGPLYRCALFDLEWNPVDFCWRGYPATARDTERPKNLELMIDEARRLSEDFMHVRVDFLSCGDRLTFSELTFSGGAARNPFDPITKNLELGRMIDLSRAPDYLDRGVRIAEKLGWRTGGPNLRLERRAAKWSASEALTYPARGI